MKKERKQKNYKKRVIIMLIASGCLAVLLAIMLILRTNENIAESFASTISRWWITISSRITSIFPFSLYETFLYVIIIVAIALFVLIIIFLSKKHWARAGMYASIILIIALVFGNVYTLSAGFAYYRTDPDLPYSEYMYLSEDEQQQLFELADFMMDDFRYLSEKMERDESGLTVMPYTFDELSDKLAEEYKRLDSDYFNDFTPHAKKITSKNIMSNMRMTGVFFAPFGEANVNPLTPPIEMAVTMAHELAHAKGVMRESDANLVAYWVTVTSDDEYLRYCGYSACYTKLISVVDYFDSARGFALRDKVSPKYITERSLGAKFWSKYDALDKITDAFYTFYLKLQGQKDGMGSYTEPTKPPSDIIVPGEGGQEEVKPVYNLNNVQRMLFEAVKSRMEASESDET